MTQPYLRYPHVHGDQVAFVADDDVWLAPVSGGRAWRLTTDHAPAATPRFAPDGTRVAYVSHRDGHPEAYVVDLSDGATRRLTWFGGNAMTVLGWDDAGRVLVSSNAGTHERSLTVVRAVGLDGAVETPRYGPAWGVAEHVGADGARTTALVSAGYRTPALWKRYRGGTASVLWLDRGTGDWQRPLPDEEAGVYDPTWIGDSLVFTSDRAATFPDHADEQANLWVLDGLATAGGTPEPRQLTFQTEAEGYVRDAASDGSRIVWHSRGDLWLLDALDGTPRRLDITLTGALPQPYSTDPASGPVPIDGVAVDGTGDASVIGWFGTAYWVTHRAGPARALVADPSVRVREPVLLGDTRRAVVVTDAPRTTPDGVSREDALEVHALPGESAGVPGTPPQTLAAGELGRVLHLAASPAGDRVAAISHDGRISVVAVPDGDPGDGPAPGTVTTIDRSANGEAESLTFSPDGRYLAWSSPTGTLADHHQILVADLHADQPTATPLTSGRFHDFSPSFSDDGKYLVLLSDRTFDPSYDSHEFALSFSAATRPWLIPLSATEPAPFGPSADGWRLAKPDGKPQAAKDDDAPEAKPDDDTAPADSSPDPSPDIDFDGAEERLVPFPVTSGRYRDLLAAKGGVLWVRETDDAGVLGARHAGTDEDPAPNVLQFWSFDARKATDVAEKVNGYAVSGDGERIVVRSGSGLATQPATSKPGDDDPGAFDIDLSRVRYEVDPRAQWHQMFDENARIMRDHYWRADMDGVDWEAVTERWRPLVDRVATHDDLEDVLWETVAELNTSHAYVHGPGERGDASRRLGLLGADLSRTADGWRIDRVLPSESSDPGARSPLRAAGVDARPGDLVVAVDGRPVDPVAGPAASLVGAAETPVELTLRRPDAAEDGTSADRRVVVVPLADESALRYQDWVRSRREYVAEKSGGRLGYVHVPDMVSTGWAQLHRDLRLATDREGVVVDVRFNGGGHTSQLVIARLAARVAGWELNRYYDRPATYPNQAPRGPVVLVTNEYAGSDGDIVNAAAQALGVGPVVGVRTWGGVIGIDGRFSLVDGTGITQPRYSFWLDGKGFGVENHGVDPDIEVRHTPADYFSDVDPQLDAGIAEAFRRLGERPAATPPALPAPRVRRRA
ncbi:S41 family peptidase [Promicromonospora thailandica]|uniref:S41 family peptidase n=1 Tax=Promicromonospora thailandica TaxID=765201 RepID=UPI0020A36C47|nr:S41 family peptidase [Promicromonospora thailandica]